MALDIPDLKGISLALCNERTELVTSRGYTRLILTSANIFHLGYYHKTIMIKFILLLLLGILLSSNGGSNGEISNTVVDLSHWNRVDFVKAKAAGIVAVVHKATEGSSYVDSKYVSRREQAINHGLLWGAYHFATGSEPIAQADHFLKTVGNTDGVLLMLDLEERTGKEMNASQAEQFVNRIKEKTGHYLMLYGSSYYMEPFNKENLNKCPLWIAHYTNRSQPKLPSHRSSWSLWQYTNGKLGGKPRTVDGIGACDRDRYNGTVEQLKSHWPYL